MHQKIEISHKTIYTGEAICPLVRGNRAQTTNADGDAIKIFGHSDDNHPKFFLLSDRQIAVKWYPR